MLVQRQRRRVLPRPGGRDAGEFDGRVTLLAMGGLVPQRPRRRLPDLACRRRMLPQDGAQCRADRGQPQAVERHRRLHVPLLRDGPLRLAARGERGTHPRDEIPVRHRVHCCIVGPRGARPPLSPPTSMTPLTTRTQPRLTMRTAPRRFLAPTRHAPPHFPRPAHGLLPIVMRRSPEVPRRDARAGGYSGWGRHTAAT